jgi:hypothetical protein
VRLSRENESLIFTLNRTESFFLASALRDLIEKYRLKPNELDAATAAAWYSPRGCVAAGMSEEETKEWLENLHALKRGTRLQELEEWAAQLAKAETERPTLRIAIGHATGFITAINDHRLAVAARHEIGQSEMDARSPWQLAKLAPVRVKAVLEIHFLAWMIEETLRVLEAT